MSRVCYNPCSPVPNYGAGLAASTQPNPAEIFFFKIHFSIKSEKGELMEEEGVVMEIS